MNNAACVWILRKLGYLFKKCPCLMLAYDPGMLKLCQNIGVDIDALYFLT